MGFKIGEMFWKIKADTKEFDSGAKKTGKEVKGLGNLVNKVGAIFTAAFAVVAIKAIGSVGKELILAASEAEETRNKFKVVFGTISESAEEAAQRIKDEFKISGQATENFLSQVGDITSGLGATSEEALVAAETITSLGLDIDSLANLTGGAGQAVSALTSLFTGEREAAKALGIVINDTNLKQYAQDTGHVFSEMTQLEKGFLSLELAEKQSALSLGDFAKSEASFANQTRIAEAATADLKTELGKKLLPVATESTRLFGEVTRELANMAKKSNDAAEAQANLNTVMSGAGGGGDLQKAFDDQREKVDELAAAIAAGGREVQKYARANRISIRSLDSLLASETGILGTLGNKLRAQQLSTMGQEEAAQAALDEAAAQEKAATELQNYLALVGTEYAETQQGKIDLLREEVALWTEYAETAVNTAPQVQEILAEKTEQLQELIDKTKELSEEDKARIEAGIADEELLAEAAIKSRDQRIAAEKMANERRMQLVSVGTNAILSSFSDIGEALVAGELGWDNFGKAGLNAVAAVLDALGAQLAAQAAALIGAAFFSGGGSLVGLGPVLAGSAAAFLAAGVTRGVANSFESGGIVPGIPSSTDNAVAAVRSGEEILSEEDPRHSNNTGSNGATFIFQFSGEKWAEVIVDDFINTGRYPIDMNRGLR